MFLFTLEKAKNCEFKNFEMQMRLNSMNGGNKQNAYVKYTHTLIKENF